MAIPSFMSCVHRLGLPRGLDPAQAYAVGELNVAAWDVLMMGAVGAMVRCCCEVLAACTMSAYHLNYLNHAAASLASRFCDCCAGGLSSMLPDACRPTRPIHAARGWGFLLVAVSRIVALA